MNIKSILEHLIAGKDLRSDEMSDVMHQIMTGQTKPAQIAGFLIALRMKGETVTEITAAAKVMRELVKPVTVSHPNLIDIVGTGGDQAHTFNISTASAFVVAAAGGVVIVNVVCLACAGFTVAAVNVGSSAWDLTLRLFGANCPEPNRYGKSIRYAARVPSFVRALA